MSTAQARRKHRGARRWQAVPHLTLTPPLYSALALVLCLGALVAVFGGAFTVNQVVIQGKGLPASAVARAAVVQGSNIFMVDSSAVVTRVSALPQVAVQRVETSFPNRVTIVARLRPAMVAWRDGTALYLVDPAGRVIGRASATTLPVITSTGPARALDPGTIIAVREAVRILPAGTVAEFRYGTNRGLSIVGRAGWTAIVGTGSSQTLANRIATLAAFLAATRSRPQQLLLVDLRYRSPYARYAP
ncbi:MAG TPA: cell division protein FtsQ/DivIB [Chloroflexota bacterium]|nr:cell division protein FtsQ/DivIB [Chloroflexota bacterium]